MAKEIVIAQEYMAPVASAVSQGSYTVSYVPNCGQLPSWGVCAFTVLQEKREPGGSWVAVSTGEQALVVSGKAPGTYSYRVHAGAYISAAGSVMEAYSPVIQVTVNALASGTAGTGSQPDTDDDLLAQMRYDYHIRQGDINGDGKLDFLVQKAAGVARNNGTIDQLLLQQTASGRRFGAVVPTAAQLSVASGWAQADVEPMLHDINVDGFVDVALDGVSAAVPGADDQIVFASGSPGQQQALAVEPFSDEMVHFVEDTMDYFVNEDYFWENAPEQYYLVSVYHAYCYGPNYTENVYFEYSNYLNWMPFMYACFMDAYHHVEAWRDYSSFSPTALDFWVSDYEASRGDRDANKALREVAADIEGLLGVEIGGWPMEEVFGSAGAPVDWLTRRGIEVVQSILGQARAGRNRTTSRLVPPQIERAPDQIYITGHPLQFAKSRGHLAVEYTDSLGGGIPYSGETFSGGPERNDLLNFGKLVAETNRPTDHPLFNFYVGDVDPRNVSESVYWETYLRERHDSYRGLSHGNKVNYALLPNSAFGTYNSNGYISGVTQDNAANAVVSVPSGMGWNYPGWGNPVPDAKFR